MPSSLRFVARELLFNFEDFSRESPSTRFGERMELTHITASANAADELMGRRVEYDASSMKSSIRWDILTRSVISIIHGSPSGEIQLLLEGHKQC